MHTLVTARLALVPVDARNARELWTVLNMPDLRRFQDIPRVALEEFERQVRSRPRALRPGNPGRYEWIVRGDEPARAIGWVSLRINERKADVGEIGYSLVDEVRGRGYATEAVGAVVDEAFRSGDLDAVQACCVPENEPSRRVLDRVGFREERVLRHGAVIRGRHVDVVLYCVTRAEWQRRGAPGAAAERA